MKKYVWDVSDESDAMNRCPKWMFDGYIIWYFQITLYMGIYVEIVCKIMLPLMTLIIVIFVIYCVLILPFIPVFEFISFVIVPLFLNMDLRIYIYIIFGWLTCLLYYIECLSFYTWLFR